MKPKTFFDAFPTPKFLDIPFAGISITDSFVNCIQFAKKGGELTILKYAERQIPPGVITLGQVNSPEEIKNILVELKNSLKLDYIKISLPEEKAYLFTEKIPVVAGAEVRSVVESKIEENVPIVPSELIFDYQLMEHSDGDHIDVVVSAIPMAVVDTYVHMAEDAGLHLLALSIESQAIAKAVLPGKSTESSLVVHFGQEKVGLYIVATGVVRFTSTVTIRAGAINSLEILGTEIKKLYMYWHTLPENVNNPTKKITQIIVCGEDFPEETVAYLHANTETQAIIGDVWTNVFDINKIVPPIDFTESLRYAPAIGLALPTAALI